MLEEEMETPVETERDRTPRRTPGITYVVFGFIAYSYLCVWWVVLIPLWTTNPSILTLLLTFFITLGGLLTVFNYYKAIYTCPGYPPANWVPPHATEEQLRDAIKNASLTRNTKARPRKSIRYCAKCKEFKPPRAHHCTECNKCILRMDHHCPWIDNCVGFFNHKYFLLFLFYGVLSQTIAIVLFGVAVVRWARDAPIRGEVDPAPDTQTSFSALRMIMMLLDLMFMVPATLGMTGLFCFQLSLVKANTTNIETFEVELEERDAPSGSMPYRWKYDRGACENLHEVFGSNALEWIVPTPVSGDGLRWRRSSLNSVLEEV